MNHAEDAECKALWEWAQYVPVLRDHLYHVPNGGKRSKVTAAIFKAMGVRPGVSDYHLPVPRGTFNGLWLEMKAGKNRATGEQKDWIGKMQAQGYAACVCYSWLEARAVLRWYLSLPIPVINPEPIDWIEVNKLRDAHAAIL